MQVTADPNANAVIVRPIGDRTGMTNESLPHRPRRRPARRPAAQCPDHDGYIYTIAYSDEIEVCAWAFTTLAAAERKFHALQKRAMAGQGDVRIHMAYTHLDCDMPHAHPFPGPAER